MREDQQPALTRTLGLLDATLIGLGAIVGAGIYVVIGVAAASAGGALPLAILIASVPAVFNALSAAACGAALPKSGGAYHFARVLISPFVGFVAGWLFVFAEVVGDSAVALGFGGYLSTAYPHIPTRLYAVALAIFVIAVNYVGLRITSLANAIFVAIKVGSLIVFVVAGAAQVQGQNFSPFAPFGWQGVIQSAALLFFAYTGYARVATLAEEVRDPRRTIPRAILSALAVAILVYASVTAVAIGVAGAEVVSSSPSPLVDAAKVSGIAYLALVLVIGAVVATGSVFLTGVTAISRIIFAMARNGEVPHALAAIHPRFGTPGRGILLAGAVIMVLVLFADLSALIAASSFALLIYYVIMNASALRLDRETRGFPAAFPILGVAGCVGLASFLPLQAILVGTLAIVAGSLLYKVMTYISEAD